jgi:hypothetical protein
MCLCGPVLAALLRFFNLGAGVPRRYEGTTGKWTKIGHPTTLINKPRPVWQGDVIRSFGCCVQYKEIVRPSRLIPPLIVLFLVHLPIDIFTLYYFAHNFALGAPRWRRWRRPDTEEEIAGRRARSVEDDMK